MSIDTTTIIVTIPVGWCVISFVAGVATALVTRWILWARMRV